MKILVTGGAGYIGSVLTPKLLDLGHEVTVYDNFMHKQNSLLDCCANKKFEIIRGDVCDYDKLNPILSNFDIIIPLAALVGAPACRANPQLTQLVNYDSYINLINNLSDSQRVIFPNTNQVFFCNFCR